jgi:hypothetical protein
VLVLIVVVTGVLAAFGWVAFILTEVPGAMEQRFGVRELPLLDTWVEDLESPLGRKAREQGLRREVRQLLEAGPWWRPSRIVVQARVRELETGRIVEVEPVRFVAVPRRAASSQGSASRH